MSVGVRLHPGNGDTWQKIAEQLDAKGLIPPKRSSTYSKSEEKEDFDSFRLWGCYSAATIWKSPDLQHITKMALIHSGRVKHRGGRIRVMRFSLPKNLFAGSRRISKGDVKRAATYLPMLSNASMRHAT